MSEQYVLAIDLGGTNIKAGVVSAAGEILLARSVKSFVRDSTSPTKLSQPAPSLAVRARPFGP